VVGRYILQPGVFDHLSSFERGAGGEIQLTDALVKMIGEGPFHGLRFAGERFDCGDKVGFLKATLAFAMRRADLAEGLRPYLSSFV
jgi:UTP-glucose-1-phosphate uridylyltransferase